MQIQVECSNCGGGGALGVVTRDMASDAGDPSMEGYVVRCDTCGGDGWVIEEVEEPEGAE